MSKLAIYFFPWIVIASPGALASPALDENNLKSQLQADVIYNIIPSQVIRNDVITPMGVRYVKKGDIATSCAIIINPAEKVVFELISPETGSDLPACGEAIRHPIVFEATDSIFAIFEYSVEDPRKEFTKTFQLFKLSPSGAIVCENNDKLDRFFQKSAKKIGIKQTFMSAIEKLGCK